MYNCIFADRCTENFCDKSCPTLAETSYLLERNSIAMNSTVFSMDEKNIEKTLDILDSSVGRFRAIETSNTMNTAELITYCAICKNWKGSRLHCDVYNLKFSRYILDLRNSWGMKKDSESLEYKRIWAETAKVLILSNMDYVSFNDYESQIFLDLVLSRSSNRDMTTIAVIPNLRQLSGKGVFFSRVQEVLGKAVL